MEHFVLEVCTDSAESAIAAQNGGATRIELCSNLIIGGTTPGISLYQAVRKYTRFPVNVLIRPRFGDFCYSEREYEMIKKDIQLFLDAGADGIVCGFLNPDGTLDKRRMEEAVGLCKSHGGKKFTLHRAFDVCSDPQKTLEQAKELGVTTILTSGQKATAMEGVGLIRKLVQNAGEIEILAGSGVNSKNLPELILSSGTKSFHMSAKKEKSSAMTYRKNGVPMGLPLMSEFLIWETDEKEVSAAHEILVNA